MSEIEQKLAEIEDGLDGMERRWVSEISFHRWARKVIGFLLVTVRSLLEDKKRLEELYRAADAAGTATLAAIVHEGDTRLTERVTRRSIELRAASMALRKMVQDEMIAAAQPVSSTTYSPDG